MKKILGYFMALLLIMYYIFVFIYSIYELRNNKDLNILLIASLPVSFILSPIIVNFIKHNNKEN
ncbi:MAG TPA: hypothetical protein GX012_02195 [Acholeplasma sp.]|nr:hypothetical protein [Acholeplasma sp.]